MKRSSLFASALLAAAPVALLLPGCGGGNGGPNPTNTPGPTSTATSTPTGTGTTSPTPTFTPTPTTTPTFRPVREFYIDASNASIVEGDSGQKQLRFTVFARDTYGEQNPLSFSYQTIDGTAVAGQDYAATSGRSSVVTGSSITISVPVLGDTLAEGDEQFTFRIFDAQGLYRTTERVGTIENDD